MTTTTLTTIESKAMQSIVELSKQQGTTTNIIGSNLPFSVLDSLVRKNAISDWWTVNGFTRISM